LAHLRCTDGVCNEEEAFERPVRFKLSEKSSGVGAGEFSKQLSKTKASEHKFSTGLKPLEVAG
jgi:hypothetical protein